MIQRSSLSINVYMQSTLHINVVLIFAGTMLEHSDAGI
jgi:hypothetical protein